MNEIKAALCDDEKTILSYVGNEIEKQFENEHIPLNLCRYSSSECLAKKIRNGEKYDIYFMDIDMPGINGLALASEIRESDSSAVIMFISAKEEYVFDTFRVNSYRFIRKMNFKNDLSEAISSFLKNHHSSSQSRVITLRAQNEIIRFNADDVIYIEAQDKYLNIVLKEKTLLIRYKMSDIESLLAEYKFLRIHKSYLVNCRFIYVIKGKDVQLENGTHLPISRYRINAVTEQFMLYMTEHSGALSQN
ncbi:MAG: LytTR family DNA-binding domain-containing protein [Lachnospiraceae bacterium]|nr:LytTR family DNA-binding domain-containing protein [Lachnospiraceae bacterium]